MKIQYDSPIKRTAEDKYDASSVSDEIAKLARDIKSDESFVIGLSGPWGSGKTSILNMAEEKLAAADESNSITVIRFNPWLFSNQEQLVASFFEELIDSLEGKKRKLSNKASSLAPLLAEYCTRIEPIASTAFVTATSPFLTPMGATALSGGASVLTKLALSYLEKKACGKSRPLASIRNQIVSLLKERENNVVVFIDDLDRLANDEICQVFKLVNLVASFPRMVYVLAYDLPVVQSALSEIQNVDGAKYLEKIVQVQISVPPFTTKCLREELVEYISLASTEQDLRDISKDDERERLSMLLDNFIVAEINTPRKVKRFHNALQLNSFKLNGQICIADLACMTELQLARPHFMEWISANKKDICGASAKSMMLKEGKPDAELLEALNSAIESDNWDFADALRVLSVLFPSSTRLLTGSYSYRSEKLGSAKAHGKVSHIDNLNLFLQMDHLPKTLRTEAYAIVLHGSRDALRKALDASISNYDFVDLLYIIKDCCPDIKKERKELLANCLIDYYGKSDEVDSSVLLGSSANSHLNRVLREIMQQLGTKSASDLMQSVIQEGDSRRLRSMVEFVRDERLARINGDETHIGVLTDECYEELTSRWKDAIYENIEDEVFNGRIFGIQIADALSKDNGDPFADVLKSRIETDVALNTVYNSCKLSLWTSGNSQHYSTVNSSASVSETAVIDVLNKELICKLTPEAGQKLAALHIMQTSGQDEVDARDAQDLYEEWLQRYGIVRS